MIKNRANTMGGQDWPKAIASLEKEAELDKNRVGDYICVFGISIEKEVNAQLGKIKKLEVLIQ